jgi:nitrogen fixation/metabolism regulation signal transduction histidine kinase
MLQREPKLPHIAMRWLIIALLLINGVQLVLLQGVINATLSLDFSSTWLFVGISLVLLLLAGAIIGYAFLRSRQLREQRDRRDRTP